MAETSPDDVPASPGLSPSTLHVEVAYALPQRQFLRAVDLPAPATLADALAASGVCARFNIDPATARVGVWSKPATLATPLRSGDRVEIYRPLRVDPKQVRRERAKQR